MNIIKQHWIAGLLILNTIFLLGFGIKLLNLEKKPALQLTEQNMKTLVEDNNALRNGVIPLLQHNVDNQRLELPPAK